jgi:tetratricopeptide (TPR) repeat protein
MGPSVGCSRRGFESDRGTLGATSTWSSSTGRTSSRRRAGPTRPYLPQSHRGNPKDWNIINKVGDLFAKLNKNREAAEYYAKVAEFYAKDGFHLKAIAIWKKINKLDATSLDPYLNLAELYGKQGLMMEAKSQYQYVVDEYIKRSKMREAGDVLKKMADIDPADLKIRSKLADPTRARLFRQAVDSTWHRGGAEQKDTGRGPAGLRRASRSTATACA